MQKMMLCLMISAFFLVTGVGCSGRQDEEKSGIEALTEQAGREAADAIKSPVDKARGVDALSRKRVEEMEAVGEAE